MCKSFFCAAVMLMPTCGFVPSVACAQQGGPIGAYDLQMWQMDPFNVGYSLTGGYRPLYSGVPQPIGHEVIETHGGKGYVYRPVYGATPFQGWQHFGSYGVVFHGTNSRALVIENPGTPYEKRFTPTTGVQAGHAAMIDVMPHVSIDALAPAYAKPFDQYVVPAGHLEPANTIRAQELPEPATHAVGTPREF